MPEAAELAIAIPAYNQGRFIAQTVESLLEQDVAPAEIVVSDNHSDDETSSVLDRFGDRIRVVRPPEHFRNYSRSWNFAVASTSAPWVAVLSSDDIALPNYVRTLRDGIGRADDAVLVSAGWQKIDARGRPVKTNHVVESTTIKRAPLNLVDQFRRCVPRFGAAAVRRDAFDAIGGFPVQIRVAGDTGLWISLCPHGSYVFEPEPVFQHRQDYRTLEQERRRQLVLIADHCTLFESIGPAVVEALGVTDDPIIADVLREYCYSTLRFASGLFEPHDCARVAGMMERWALDSGLGSELELLRQGRRIPRKPYPPIRLFASDVAEFLKSMRPWRRDSRVRRALSRS